MGTVNQIMKHSKYYTEGYEAWDPRTQCPYDADTWPDSAKADDWYRGRSEAQEDRRRARLRERFRVQQYFTKDDFVDEPYIIKRTVTYEAVFNPDFDQDKKCECGHPYHRHFDGYEDNAAVGCKYCGDCPTFKEKL